MPKVLIRASRGPASQNVGSYDELRGRSALPACRAGGSEVLST